MDTLISDKYRAKDIGGHHGKAATESEVWKSFWRRELKADVTEFVQGRIHSVVSRSSERIPRPLSTALHDRHPNEVPHIDILYIRQAENWKLKCVLDMKDD